MLAREMWSYAPTPSMLSTVVQGSVFVATRRARTTASSPALVLSAYWKGAQASRKASPKCCAKVRATRRRKTSPITSARTPPVGFVSATMRPRRNALTNSGGTAPCASLAAAKARSSVVCSSSRKTRRCSLVQPEGPAAAPRRARCKLSSNFWGHSCGIPKCTKGRSISWG